MSKQDLNWDPILESQPVMQNADLKYLVESRRALIMNILLARVSLMFLKLTFSSTLGGFELDKMTLKKFRTFNKM